MGDWPDGLIDWEWRLLPSSREAIVENQCGIYMRLRLRLRETRLQAMILKGLVVLAELHSFKDGGKLRITLCVSTLLRSTGYTDVASRKFLHLSGSMVLLSAGKQGIPRIQPATTTIRQLAVCILVSCTATHHRHTILAPCLDLIEIHHDSEWVKQSGVLNPA